MLTHDMEKDWMESRGINTAIVWTEQEKKWLEEREERFAIHGIYSNPQIIPSYWQLFALTPSYKDAAEFEARVAAWDAIGVCHNCKDKGSGQTAWDCIRRYGGRLGAAACRLKHARLQVETEGEP